MSDRIHCRSHKLASHPRFDRIALLLPGGGALGAYEAGVYEALAEAGLQPNWVAGISIGAINAAIIAGNPVDLRVRRLRDFWEHITMDPWRAAWVLLGGVPGFFAPRLPSPWLHPTGTRGAASYYDTGELKTTLERFVDFDRLNAGNTRFSAGAVNVRTGDIVYFDTMTHVIGPEHVMASGALPPGFPAVEIEGEHYWDGGLVSNTPLQWVIESGPPQDTLAIEVDLWTSRGELPRNMTEVATRQKEIQYSSRTRANTDFLRHTKKLRSAIADLLAKLPEPLRSGREAALLSAVADRSVCKVVRLSYRPMDYEGYAKDYEFSRASMEAHWRAGYRDALRTLRHPEALERPVSPESVATFDLTGDARE